MYVWDQSPVFDPHGAVFASKVEGRGAVQHLRSRDDEDGASLVVVADVRQVADLGGADVPDAALVPEDHD